MGRDAGDGRPRPHVLKIAPTPFFADRGCHVRILEEARALQARGFRVTICTYHLGRDVSGMTVRRSLRVPWYKRLEAGPSVHKFYVDLLLAWTVLCQCLRDRPDVIHAHLHEGIVVGWPAKMLFRIPLVADLQGSLTGELLQHDFFRPGGLLHRLFRFVERTVLRMPSAFVVSSLGPIENTITDPAKLNVPSRFIPDGVDVEVFHPARPDEKLREALSLPQGVKIVGYLGLLSEYQGVGVLLEAARHVLEKSERVRFLVMGYPAVDHYREVARRLGIAEKVIFTDRLPYGRARDYLAACDVAVSAKQPVTEANGKLLNYMAVGLPVVATDTAINRELLGDDGVYAAVDDPTSLAHALLRVLEDEGFARELGARLRRRAVQDLSWNAGGDAIVEVYTSLDPKLRGTTGSEEEAGGGNSPEGEDA
jgi:glycosyltransferase involved in cell wall biosynthesis